MFPTQSKVNRYSTLWLLPVVALVMLLVGYAVFAASTAQAQTPAGDYCIEGVVIDWEEKPLAGWAITLTSDITIPGALDGNITTTVSAMEPAAADDDHNGQRPNSDGPSSSGHEGKGAPEAEYGKGGPEAKGAPEAEYGKGGPEAKGAPEAEYGKGGPEGAPSNGPEAGYGKESGKPNFAYKDVNDELQKGEFEFQDLLGVAGTYTATIETRPGWEGVTPTTISFPIEVGEDGCAQIRFKMRRLVVVRVYKIDADHNPLGGWKIKAVPGPGNLFASPQTATTSVTGTAGITDTNGMTGTNGVTGTEAITGSAVFTLTPGLWIFTEMAPNQDADGPREAYVPIVPPTGRQELLIDDEDTALTLVFKNDLVTGCFIVRKVGSVGEMPTPTTPTALLEGYNVAGWGFQLLRADGSVARQGVTDGSGEIRFDNLPLGPYTIVEEDRPGWNELDAIEQDYNVTGNNCEPGDPVVVFTNEQDDSGFCIEGRKVDANGGYGIPNWEIALEPLDEGGVDVDNVFTDGLGNFTFEFAIDDYRVPGGLFEVCELEQDGWLAHTPTCQTVRMPEWPSACVQLKDFVNQQVGHSESQKEHNGGPEGNNNEYGKGGEPSKGGNHDLSCSSYHEVKAGEGLYDIGREHNLTPQQMLDANPSVRDSEHQWVIVGQRICIP
jgi:hypothetical protein